MLPRVQGEGFFREELDVTESARGKELVPERFDVTGNVRGESGPSVET